ncbi:MAG: hypothetical protein K6L73_06475 [Cellvibrionaceae bacterium]
MINYLQGKNRRQQQGQAMAEFVVAAATVLVPLFLILPLIGKYADINLTSVETARYVAWERSVWHEPSNLPTGISIPMGETFPSKTDLTIRNEARSRFFGELEREVYSTSGRTLSQAELNPFWHDHDGIAMITVSDTGVNVPDLDETPGIGYEVVRVFTGILDLLYTPLSWLGGTASFDPNLDGYADPGNGPTVSIPINASSGYMLQTMFNPLGEYTPSQNLTTVDLTFEANAGLLVDTWSVQGSEHFENQTGGLVPTSLLDFPLLNTLRDIAATILFEPKLAEPAEGEDTGLDMGGFRTDPFQLDADQTSEDFCNDDGLCSFEG